MASLATKLKQILINRSKPSTNDVLLLSNLTSTSQAPFVSSDTSPNPNLDKIIPIPTHITDTLPQELYEIFIDYLQDEVESLRACSLVCSAWTRTSQRRLFLLLVRPYQLSSKAGFRFKDPVRCAVIHEKTNIIYYGTTRGVYSRSLDKPDEIPVKRLSFVDIHQMNIIDRAAAQGGSVLVFRSAVYLYTIELKHLQPSTNSKERPPKPLRWSDELETTYYMIGLLSGGGITIAAVHGKDVHVLRLRHGGVNLISHWFCVASQPPTSVFLHRGHIICTYPKSGFECRDPINWNDKEMLPKLASGPAIQTYLAAMTVTIPGRLGLGGTTAGASVRTTYMVLCYDSYAIYMDDRKVLHGPPITWHYPAKEIYFQDNRAYIISSTHLEIRSLLGPSPHTGNQSQTQNEVQNRNETAVQLIEGKFRVLSGKSSTKIVILREDGYIYGFRPRQNLT